MNDEPTTSSAISPPPPPMTRSSQSSTHDDTAADASESDAATILQRKNREYLVRKRGELMDDALRNLDVLVYAELSVIYYMDCHTWRFLLRCLIQMVLLTPKTGLLPEPPANRPALGAILGANILCIILHLFSAAPAAGEATRGYLHGGFVMDFIGQRGPSSKIHLLILDALVVLLQVVHLSAYLARRRLKKEDVSERLMAVFSQDQDLEDEERGVRHSIELQELSNVEQGHSALQESDDSIDDLATGGSNEASASTSSLPPRTDGHLIDAINSGQIVLADFNIVQTFQEQLLSASKSAAPDPFRTESRRLLAERFAGLRIQWSR